MTLDGSVNVFVLRFRPDGTIGDLNGKIRECAINSSEFCVGEQTSRMKDSRMSARLLNVVRCKSPVEVNGCTQGRHGIRRP
jgi:hypothetical protein